MAPWLTGPGPPVTRAALLERLRRVVRRDSPHLLMTVIVTATALCGFLASAVLLNQVGLERMWLRYGLSVIAAYGAFIFFIWLWILKKRRMRPEDPGWNEGVSDVGVHEPPAPGEGPAVVGDHASPSSDPNLGGGAGQRGGGGLDLDEGIVVVAVLVAVVAAIAAAGYVVFGATELLAELLLDGALAAGLYRRLRRLDRRNWIETAVARTWMPIAVVAIFFTIAGAVCQWYAPEAQTLGDVWRHSRARRGH